jgi:hypothetical protein
VRNEDAPYYPEEAKTLLDKLEIYNAMEGTHFTQFFIPELSHVEKKYNYQVLNLMSKGALIHALSEATRKSSELLRNFRHEINRMRSKAHKEELALVWSNQYTVPKKTANHDWTLK